MRCGRWTILGPFRRDISLVAATVGPGQRRAGDMKTDLPGVVKALERIAPLALAEEWDNVGLLVEAPARDRSGGRSVRRILLTVDLTPPVLEEARNDRADLVVSYHPPIFHPLRRLTRVEPLQGVVLDAVAAGISIYSPHTALDAAAGGVNDWLAAGVGPGTVEVLEPRAGSDGRGDLKLVIFVPAADADRLRDALAERAGAGVIGEYRKCSFAGAGRGTFLPGDRARPVVGQRGRIESVEEIRLEMVCPESGLPEAARAMVEVHPYEEPAWDAYRLYPRPEAGVGQGRLVRLARSARLETVVRRVKRHVGLSRVRVARGHGGSGSPAVRSVALCAGAGASVLRGRRADVYLTGEMGHHELLAAVASGIHVILTEHSNSERGYLATYAERLRAALGPRVDVRISGVDADPVGWA